MTRVRLWPRGLTGRVTLVLLAAILIEFFGTILVFGQAERLLLRTGQAHRVAEQLVVADRVLNRTPPSRRREIAPSLSTRHVRFALEPAPRNAAYDSSVARAAAGEVLDWEPGLRQRELKVGVAPPGDGTGDRLVGALRMANGQWISFRSTEAVTRWSAPQEWLLKMALLVCLVLLIAALLVRTLAAPLRALAAATDRIGFSSARVVVEPGGPQELRRLAEAFNAMQARITELIEGRTRALLAVSHDLRIPLSRLKLRLYGRLRDGDMDALRSDVDEMQAMLDSLLDYLGGGDGTGPDPAVMIDLAPMIARLAGDMSSTEAAPVDLHGPERLKAVVHQVALRRAVANLLDNAQKCGGRAEIHYGRTNDTVWIEVRDQGPGIPEDQLGEVTLPFVRGDNARARDTKGFGLGLAIVTHVAQLHGGALSLHNGTPGLIARLTLPVHGRSVERNARGKAMETL